MCNAVKLDTSSGIVPIMWNASVMCRVTWNAYEWYKHNAYVVQWPSSPRRGCLEGCCAQKYVMCSTKIRVSRITLIRWGLPEFSAGLRLNNVERLISHESAWCASGVLSKIEGLMFWGRLLSNGTHVIFEFHEFLNGSSALLNARFSCPVMTTPSCVPELSWLLSGRDAVRDAQETIN